MAPLFLTCFSEYDEGKGKFKMSMCWTKH